MGIWGKVFAVTIISVILLSSGFIGMSQFVFADNDNKQEKWRKTTLEDLGILQIAAHDFFNVDRGNRIDADTATEREDGKLNLTTLFMDTITGEKFTDAEIALGGEFRNRENIMLLTVASEYGERYLDLKEEMSAKKAQKQVIKEFNAEIKEVYERMMDEPYPDKIKGKAEATRNFYFSKCFRNYQ
jgi:hypothetical protein